MYKRNNITITWAPAEISIATQVCGTARSVSTTSAITSRSARGPMRYGSGRAGQRDAICFTGRRLSVNCRNLTALVKHPRQMIDCLIIGGGPAGLLAATYLARYRRRTCVIDAGQSRAAKIAASHNYPGFAGIGGQELLRRLWAQAQRYGADLATDRVTQLRKDENTFTATCAQRGELKAQFVLLATGLVDRCLPIHGQSNAKSFEAVRFCPIC